MTRGRDAAGCEDPDTLRGKRAIHALGSELRVGATPAHPLRTGPRSERPGCFREPLLLPVHSSGLDEGDAAAGTCGGGYPDREEPAELLSMTLK